MAMGLCSILYGLPMKRRWKESRTGLQIMGATFAPKPRAGPDPAKPNCQNILGWFQYRDSYRKQFTVGRWNILRVIARDFTIFYGYLQLALTHK